MSETLKVGDLVIVARDNRCVCGITSPGYFGRIFRVGEIRLSRGRFCVECERRKPDTVVATPDERLLSRRGDNLIFALSILKRIPPLGELEGIRTEEDIREPA